MYTPKEIQNLLEQRFKDINWEVEPTGLYSPIGYILALGGKRIRPVLTIMAANLFSENINTAINPAIGLEIFHNFTLLHDDIMDKASVRRGKPTVHVKWNENTAILSGDAMLVKAYQYITQAPEKCLTKVLDVFSQTALEVCEGQQFDMEFESRENVSTIEYLEMIRLKTAVLLAAGLKIGALIAGADEASANQLYDFGINLGLGFQLKDDLLDVYGNPAVFGKQIGGDILSNKKTYLLISALNHANDLEKEELLQWIACKDFVSEEKIKAVTSLYNKIGAKEICEQKMEEYFASAKICLENICVDSTKKEFLLDLANSLIKREV